MSCRVAPVCARSAKHSPTTDANLNPWPEQAEHTTTCAARVSLRLTRPEGGKLHAATADPPGYALKACVFIECELGACVS